MGLRSALRTVPPFTLFAFDFDLAFFHCIATPVHSHCCGCIIDQ
jgi:hypothetical protein